MPSRTLAVTFGTFALTLGLGACANTSDPDIAHAEIGPHGGLLSSIDDILTIAIQPGSLEQTIELTIARSTEPPDVYGPAFLVWPNVELAIPATVTYRYPLPDDTRTTTVGYVDPQEYAEDIGRWRPLPVLRLDPAQELVTGADEQLSLFYTLLDQSDPSTTDIGETTTTGTTLGAESGTDTSAGTAIEPDSTSTTTGDLR